MRTRGGARGCGGRGVEALSGRVEAGGSWKLEHNKVRARRPRGPKAGAHRWRVQKPDLAKVQEPDLAKAQEPDLAKARGSHKLRMGRGQRAEP